MRFLERAIINSQCFDDLKIIPKDHTGACLKGLSFNLQALTDRANQCGN